MLTNPTWSAVPGRRGTPRRRRAGTGAAVAGLFTACLLRGGLPQALVDVGHHAVVRVEELLVDGRPAAHVGDLEQVRRRGELVRPGDALRHRPVPLLDEDLLRFVGAGEVDEVLSRCARRLGDGDRVLD